MSLGRPRATCALFQHHISALSVAAHNQVFNPLSYCPKRRTVRRPKRNPILRKIPQNHSQKQVFRKPDFPAIKGRYSGVFIYPKTCADAGLDFPPLFPAKPPPLPQSQFAIKTAFGLFASRRHLQANRILKNICNIRRGNQNRHRHCN